MSALHVYTDYLALKQHFTNEKYDYFKYSKKTKSITIDSLEKRKDKYYFIKLASNRSYKEFLIANFVNDSGFWIGDMSDPERVSAFERWQKKIQSLSYSFKSELSVLDEDFNSNFVIKNNSHPNVVRLYLQKKLSLETLIILIDITGTYRYNNTKLDDAVWNELSFKIKKYYPFLSSYYDRDKLKKEVVKYFS